LITSLLVSRKQQRNLPREFGPMELENAMNQLDRTRPVHRLLEQEQYGVLATLSRKAEGWPFGSLTPFALAEDGQPLVLLSGLAEHTQNLLADPRVSLFVQDSQALANPQAGARATLLCLAEALSDSAAAQPIYLQRFPDAVALLQLGDFRFFRLKIERVRFIGGFGEMYWISGTDF
jgi:putative heme iron utilization protein